MIRLDQLSYRFRHFALGPITLHIKPREFYTLLGPTGSGKTIILESIAGLQHPHTGSIYLSGREVTKVPPEKRHVGIVYQDQALFPHLNVRENITFGLRYHQGGIGNQRTLLENVIETLELETHLEKRPSTLSGGEKQRVALARALAIQPQLLLLDEPLSAIDPCFRSEIQQLLKQLHQTVATTFLMVTHDFHEAVFLADTVGILHQGILEQSGTVEEVFHHPRTHAVAEFVGMKNLFTPTWNGSSCSFAGITFHPEPPCNGGSIGLRPEDILVDTTPSFPAGFLVCRGTLANIHLQGVGCEMTICRNGLTFIAHGHKGLLRQQGLVTGAQVYLGFARESVHFFPAQPHPD